MSVKTNLMPTYFTEKVMKRELRHGECSALYSCYTCRNSRYWRTQLIYFFQVIGESLPKVLYDTVPIVSFTRNHVVI